MPIFQEDHDQVFLPDGTPVSDDIVQRDVTEEATEYDLYAKARTAIVNNQTFLDTPNGNITQADALVQLKAITRQVNALIRLLPQARDLLVENTDT